MPSFCAADGTELAYHVQGAPLVCLPGGPGRASSYLAISAAYPRIGG